MRLWTLVFASTLLGAGVVTPALAEQLEASEAVVRWEDFDDPDFDPTRSQPRSSRTSQASRSSSRAHSITLGPMGVDEQGVAGRIHTVARRDTLWDITEAYLGTPWVWPAVWNENAAIHNPHVIEPGDHIWITSAEMRRISTEEAEQLMTSASETAEPPVAYEPEALPEPDPELAAAPAPEKSHEPALPVAAEVGPVMTGDIVKIRPDQARLLVTSDVIDAATQIVDSPTLRVFLTQTDEVYLELGEGEVEVGDRFTIFREPRPIRDSETRRLIGYHIDELGWMVVRSVEGQSSIAVIAEAVEDIQRGDLAIPKQRLEEEIAVRETQEGVEGLIALMPGARRLMGTADSVYVNRGSMHGIELGSQLEVYQRHSDLARPSRFEMPDSVVAHLVVINVHPEVSAALITWTRRELEIGDPIRGATPPRFAGR